MARTSQLSNILAREIHSFATSLTVKNYVKKWPEFRKSFVNSFVKCTVNSGYRLKLCKNYKNLISTLDEKNCTIAAYRPCVWIALRSHNHKNRKQTELHRSAYKGEWPQLKLFSGPRKLLNNMHVLRLAQHSKHYKPQKVLLTSFQWSHFGIFIDWP